MGEFHGGGFTRFNSIYTLFYGGFLQVFQTALGWKIIQGKDATKTYQQVGSLVNMVYTVVMRDLSYMHAEWYIHKHSKAEISYPATVALKLVYLFDKYMPLKLKSSKDELL